MEHVLAHIIPSTTELSLLLKDQLTGGTTQDESDLIYYFDPEVQDFLIAWYNTATEEWEGDLHELHHQRGYLAFIRPEHSSPVISLLGTLACDEQSIQIFEGWNLIGYPFTSTVRLDSSRLTDSGLEGGIKPWQSDRIYAYSNQTYSSVWRYIDGAAWVGGFSEMELSKGYWLLRLSGRGEFQWRCSRPGNSQ